MSNLDRSHPAFKNNAAPFFNILDHADNLHVYKDRNILHWVDFADTLSAFKAMQD